MLQFTIKSLTLSPLSQCYRHLSFSFLNINTEHIGRDYKQRLSDSFMRYLVQSPASLPPSLPPTSPYVMTPNSKVIRYFYDSISALLTPCHSLVLFGSLKIVGDWVLIKKKSVAIRISSFNTFYRIKIKWWQSLMKLTSW